MEYDFLRIRGEIFMGAACQIRFGEDVEGGNIEGDAFTMCMCMCRTMSIAVCVCSIVCVVCIIGIGF